VCTFALLIYSEPAYPQSNSIITANHLEKIDKAKSARDKLRLYKKYYSKDSAKLSRQYDKYLQWQLDSICNQLNQNEEGTKELRSHALRRVRKHGSQRLEVDGLREGINENIPDSAAVIEFKQPSRLLTNGIHLDSSTLRRETSKGVNAAKSHAAFGEVIVTSNQVREHQTRVLGYKNQADSLKNKSTHQASIQREAANEAQARLSKFKATRLLEQQRKAAERTRSQVDRYKQMGGEVQDTTYQREQAKKRAQELAMDYVTKNPQVMDAVKKRTTLLMKVYSVVPNSNDLTTAVKRSSLKGKSFRERIFLGGNFQLVSLRPVAIEFSPTIGYRINSRWTMGLGLNYRKTFNDTLSRVASNMIGGKSFLSYDVIRNFFIYGEYSRNSRGLGKEETSQDRIWNSALLLGVGRKISLHPRLDMSAVVLYNVRFENHSDVYAGRWVFRIGFQTSALGFVRRKPSS
jgi:hypothetical protein